MSLLLQNSAGQMAVGLGEGDRLIFDSSRDAALVGLRNVQAYVQAGLDQSGRAMSDVGCVFVDIGPGGWARPAPLWPLPMLWASPRRSR